MFSIGRKKIQPLSYLLSRRKFQQSSSCHMIQKPGRKRLGSSSDKRGAETFGGRAHWNPDEPQEYSPTANTFPCTHFIAYFSVLWLGLGSQLRSSLWLWTHYCSQLTVTLLPRPPKCWDYRYTPAFSCTLEQNFLSPHEALFIHHWSHSFSEYIISVVLPHRPILPATLEAEAGGSKTQNQ